jgi:hypothetical protein
MAGTRDRVRTTAHRWRSSLSRAGATLSLYLCGLRLLIPPADFRRLEPWNAP